MRSCRLPNFSWFHENGVIWNNLAIQFYSLILLGICLEGLNLFLKLQLLIIEPFSPFSLNTSEPCHLIFWYHRLQVRDQLTTRYEQESIKAGKLQKGGLRKDAIEVDAIVSTIGFPLVGGPAGSMEAGRQSEIAKSILGAKNVPYIVAAPLLIQVSFHIHDSFWFRDRQCMSNFPRKYESKKMGRHCHWK